MDIRIPRAYGCPQARKTNFATEPREKVVKIGAKVIAHACSTVFQMAEVAIPRELFRRILEMIGEFRPKPVARC